ncbi:MAG: Sir2 family NAD+-dependent deacetylase [Oligoflexales bacterium]
MKYNSIVILTGAGISAESGINTFRASDGLWENHPIEKVATPEGFRKDPKLVHQFYNERRNQLLNPAISPNAAHLALAKLEKDYLGNVWVVTQNIDNLHERAGSKNLIHMHGEILKIRCKKSGQIYSCHEPISNNDNCSCCELTGTLRPHIVWFGEMPFFMDEIYQHLDQASIFVSIGTSGNVYPAAGFVEHARESGARCIEINPQPTYNPNFDDFRQGVASIEVPKLVSQIIEKKL